MELNFKVCFYGCFLTKLKYIFTYLDDLLHTDNNTTPSTLSINSMYVCISFS